MWVANMIKSDIANEVREKARHGHVTSAIHWSTVVNITRYLRRTRELGLVFRKERGLDIFEYAYSNIDRNKDYRRSLPENDVLCESSLIP